MVLKRVCDLRHHNAPLEFDDVPTPVPQAHQILIAVSACGVCHTELDEIEGRTQPHFPVIPGHQVVGEVVSTGVAVTRFKSGDRVGVAWIFSACGKCRFCQAGHENLCPEFQATGCDANGGYAEYMTAFEDFAYRIPGAFSDVQAAPLLCAGAIGYRSLRLTGLEDGQRLGLTGFGASAHLVLKMVTHRFPRSQVCVFARSARERSFAMDMGAVWAGDTVEAPPDLLDSIIDTTPAWKPVVSALAALKPGGRLVINAIRKETRDLDNLLTLDYARHLWMEKEIKSVANVARKDVSEFLDLAAEIPILPVVQTYALSDANRALMDLKARRIRGAKVLTLDTG